MGSMHLSLSANAVKSPNSAGVLAQLFVCMRLYVDLKVGVNNYVYVYVSAYLDICTHTFV